MKRWVKLKDKNKYLLSYFKDFSTDRFYDTSLSKTRDLIGDWYQGLYRLSKANRLDYDQVLTVKNCDANTTLHLHNVPTNLISLHIQCPIGAKFKTNEQDELLYHMLVQIESLDDASYSIWFDEIPLRELEYIRYKLMEYIDGF